MHTYKIQHATREEVDIMAAWAAKEGWNPGLNDAECFYQTDPNGFFVGKLEGKIIAAGSAVVYDNNFAFCGFYIVDAPYRTKGYGLALTKQRLAYIGNRNAGLDGVVDMLAKYERLGYQIAHNNIRYQGTGSSSQIENEHIVNLNQLEFSKIAQFDRQFFPAPREAFLRCWIKQPDGVSLGYIENHQLQGYGVLRPCQVGYKIGPLFANNETIAEQLFLALTSYCNNKQFYLDIPANNPYAVALVDKYKLEKIFETARMYLRGDPGLPMENIFGITTFELG